jgi:hypothetical protein
MESIAVTYLHDISAGDSIRLIPNSKSRFICFLSNEARYSMKASKICLLP